MEAVLFWGFICFQFSEDVPIADPFTEKQAGFSAAGQSYIAI